jgi:hypothetical protein
MRESRTSGSEGGARSHVRAPTPIKGLMSEQLEGRPPSRPPQQASAPIL